MRKSFAVALTVVSMLTQSGLASAAIQLGPAFTPKGEVRMTSVAANNPITTTASFSTGFVGIPDMIIPVTIPRGFIADVQIFFTGEMNSADAQYVAALVDGFPTSPGIVQAFWGVHGGATSQAANFAAFLTAGDHTIQMEWGGLGGQQFMSARQLTVILSVRRTIGHSDNG
ncbi:MAG TPA: hypothetical protein VFD92_24575 [Candidatus Binatia bacterium]|nr:hypothetical protein [Candidatus Binatia bacterium]